MSSNHHWLPRLYVTMMAAKHPRHEMEMGKYADFLNLWPQLLHVMFSNDFYDDKTKFGANIGFEDLIGVHCHWTCVLINERAVARIENSPGDLPQTVKPPDFCTIWGEEFIGYSKGRKNCKVNLCALYQRIYNLADWECTHGTVMFCYPVVLCASTLWLPGCDSHGTELSVTPETICSWPTAAVLLPGNAHFQLHTGMPLGTCHQQLPGRETETTSPQVISDRWDQPPFSAFPVATGFPEERQSTAAWLWHRFQRSLDGPAACRSAPGSCPAPLSPTEQVKTHLTERQRAPRGNLPANSTKRGTARAEVTCECSLQRWHSGKVLGMSSVLTRHRRIHTRGNTWDIPPNQHKKSVHREQEHWHCLNKHTHHEVLRGVRGFLDILIL